MSLFVVVILVMMALLAATIMISVMAVHLA